MTEFVGIELLKQKQADQVKIFEEWAENGDWAEFHRNHYDWWTFPIDAPSSFGFKYTLDQNSLAQLRQDQEFLESLAKAATLLLRSWGWDIARSEHLASTAPDQGWANWPIRLSKCNRSLKLFGLIEMANSTALYAQWLKANGESFLYQGRDLFEEIQGSIG